MPAPGWAVTVRCSLADGSAPSPCRRVPTKKTAEPGGVTVFTRASSVGSRSPGVLVAVADPFGDTPALVLECTRRGHARLLPSGRRRPIRRHCRRGPWRGRLRVAMVRCSCRRQPWPRRTLWPLRAIDSTFGRYQALGLSAGSTRSGRTGGWRRRRSGRAGLYGEYRRAHGFDLAGSLTLAGRRGRAHPPVRLDGLTECRSRATGRSPRLRLALWWA